MRKSFRQALSLLLTFALIFSLVLPAYAVEGNGTSDSTPVTDTTGGAANTGDQGANGGSEDGGSSTKTYVAQIGEAGYETLSEAITKAASGDTVTLLTDIYLEETVTISTDQTITLDLNGQKITVSQTDGRSLYAIDNYGTLTIQDGSEEAAGVITARGVENFGTMYMTSGTIESCDSNGGGAAVWNEGAFEMTGGTLRFTGAALGNSTGSPFYNEGSGATAAITGGSLESPYTCLFVGGGEVKLENISMSNSTVGWLCVKVTGGSAELNNVTISSENGGCLEVAGGAAVVTNCTFNQTGTGDHTSTAVAASYGGSVTISGNSGIYNASGYGVYVYNTGGTITVESGSISGSLAAAKADIVEGGQNSVIEIKGGTVTGDITTGGSSSSGNTATIDISGGEVTGNITVTNAALNISGGSVNGSITEGSGATVSITGGTFSSDVTTYLADDLKTTENADGTYTVVSAYAASVADSDGNITKYVTLAKAISAVASGYTITLLADATESITIPADKNITLNLNGHTLTNEAGEDTITVALGGTLTVTGEGTVDNVSSSKTAVYNNGTCTLSGGTYTRTAGTWYTICNHGEMTINEGVTVTVDASVDSTSSMIENGYYSYSGTNERNNYFEGVNQARPSLTINGGTFTGGANTVKNDDGGILKITGGEFTCFTARQAAIYNAGVAEITGGTFTSTVSSGYAIYNLSNTLTIEEESVSTATTVSGGSFSGQINVASDTTLAISGGTFTAALKEAWCAEDYVPITTGVEGETRYTVGVGTNVVAVIHTDETGAETTTNYTSLARAVAAAASGDTIQLLTNVAVAAGDYVKISGKELTLDLAGHSITRNNGTTSSAYLIYLTSTGTELTVTDSVGNGSINGGNNPASEAIYVGSKSKVTIQGGTVQGKTYGIYVYTGATLDVQGGTVSGGINNTSTTTNGGIYIGSSTANVTISGGQVEGGSYGVYDLYGNLTVEDGAVISGETYGILAGYAPTSASSVSNVSSIVINGGSITGGTGGVCIGKVGASSTLTVTGGTITGTDETTSYGIYAASAKATTIDITGGEISGVTYGVYEAATVAPTLTISEGDEGTVPIISGTEAALSSTNCTGFVSGGKFSSQVPEDYCASGYEPVEETDSDDMYSVQKIKVAQIGNVAYETLAEAYAAAQDNDTITLLADIALDTRVNISNKTVTLNLAGHSITRGESNTASWLIGVASTGALTVKDTVGGGSIKFENYTVTNADGSTTTYGGYGILTNGTVEIQSGTVSGYYGVYVSGADAKATVSGGTVSGQFYGIVDYIGTVEVTGGSVTANTFGIALQSASDQPATADISGGTVYGGDTAIVINANRAALGEGETLDAKEAYTSVVNLSGSAEVKGGSFGITLWGKGAELNVSDSAAVSAPYFAISGNGSYSASSNESGTTINITGGTISATGETGTGIYHPQDGTLTISGGTISGATGVEMRAGELTVSDGSTIKGTGNPLESDPNGSGTTTIGAGIAVVEHTTKLGVKVTISGGEISGYNALYQKDLQGSGNEDVILSVTGGEFTSSNEGEDAAVLSTEVTGYVSGGSFSSKVPEDYCASGYLPTEKDEDGRYTVEQFVLGVSNDDTVKVPATLRSGQGTGTVFVEVSADNIADNYSTAAYPTTSLTFGDDVNGYVFAGWYEDADGTTPCTTFPTVTAYAKFVDEDVLQAMWQMSADTTSESESTNLRFVTTVDSLDYQQVGFVISISGGGKATVMTTTVYEQITGYTDKGTAFYSPSVFSETSKYFMTYKLNNVPSNAFNKEFTVVPQWITYDGTTVTGQALTFTIQNQLGSAETD